MQISDEHFRGRTVIAADGQAIGEVSALLIDISAWNIVALRIKLNKAAAENSVLPEASSALPHWSYLSAWSSR